MKHRKKTIAARPIKLHEDRAIEQEVRIEIIPLIDVIFCILTFFILAAVGLSRQQAIGLNLPKATTGKPQMREMLVVSLDDIGQVYVQQELVTRKQFSQEIKNYHEKNPNALMVLNASKNSSYNDVVKILDVLRQVGGNRVALATLPEDGKKPEDLNLIPSANGNLNPYGGRLPNSSYNPSQLSLPISPSQGLGNSQFNPSLPPIQGLPTPPKTP
jgi:biopolymer transport protein ExbD